MKISPVQGMPTIQNPSATGLSTEKLQRIRAIAENKTPEPLQEPEKQSISLGDMPTSATQRIKMNVNRSTMLPIEQENAAPLEETDGVAGVVPAVVVPDNDVQAKSPTGVTGTISPELAELAKQKRAVQLEREQLAKEREMPQGTPEGFISLKDLQANALSVLQKNGITYEQLTNEILGTQSAQPDLGKFKEDLLKTIDEKLAGKDSAQEEAVYSYMKQEVDKMSNLQPYRFIRENKGQDKVMDLIKRSWKEKGEILTEEEAMNLIESEFREDARRYAKLIGELEKPAAPAEVPPNETETRTQAKTLTNKDSARPVMGRRQRAIAAALGQK